MSIFLTTPPPPPTLMSTLSRRQIVRACKERGWTLQPGALHGLQASAGDDAALAHWLNRLAPRVDSKILTDDIWNEYLASLEEVGPDKRKTMTRTTTTTTLAEGPYVIGAFETPKLVYQVMRKQFQVEERRGSLFGSAEDKANMLAQRYALIHQRLLRHDLFRPNDLGHVRQSTQHRLTPIESLLGQSSSRSVLLLGILIQIEEGQYYLEDPTGQVPVDVGQASAVDGFYVTEHNILLVEGQLIDGRFYAHRLGQPLLETRKASLSAIQQHVSHPLYTSKPTIEAHSLVILSDMHVDQPLVIQHLESILAGYENYSVDRLPCFVLCGNFSSTSEPAPLEELFRTIAQFSHLAQHAHFVLVGGPRDAGGVDAGPLVLPWPAVSASVPSSLAHVHLTSNPARLQWHDQEVVVFRYDVLHLLQRQQIRLPMVGEDNIDEAREHHRQAHCRLVKTLLDQGHLVPVAGLPIYWNYDHALRLYPLPDVLVLGGDGRDEGFYEVYGGCHVVHPGSMSRGNYAVYSVGDKDDEDDDEEEGVRVRVEFGRLGMEDR